MALWEGTHDGRGLRLAVVVSRFNDFVTDRLHQGASEALRTAGVQPEDIETLRVPGAFEIPVAARGCAASGRFDAIICLGCLIRGETSHFDYISSAVAHALQLVAATTGVPVAFGVLTTHSAEQALARAGQGPSNKGWEAAMAAVEMGTLFKRMQGTRSPGVRV